MSHTQLCFILFLPHMMPLIPFHTILWCGNRGHSTISIDTSTTTVHFISAFKHSLHGNLEEQTLRCVRIHCVCSCVCVCTPIKCVIQLYPQDLESELLERRAAVFTTCYETRLLCNSDSVIQIEMKVMLLHIRTFHFLGYFPNVPV